MKDCKKQGIKVSFTLSLDDFEKFQDLSLFMSNPDIFRRPSQAMKFLIRTWPDLIDFIRERDLTINKYKEGWMLAQEISEVMEKYRERIQGDIAKKIIPFPVKAVNS